MAIGSHHSARAGTDVWLTPPNILEALGGADSFDLDPCAPLNRPWDMARNHYTIDDDGLARPWSGRVWLNPPYANGVIGTIDNCRQAVYGYDQRIEVFGSKGNLVAANNVPHRVAHSNAAGVHTALPLNFFIERYAQAYIDELKAFVQAVVEDTPPPVTGLDGRIPVVMGLAAGKSYRENRPVKLSEVGG